MWTATIAIYSENNWISDVLTGLTIAVTATIVAKCE
jgi:hypothetical protein